MIRHAWWWARIWWEARAEARRTHCCWCLLLLDPLDALTTARTGRIVHPACKPAADLHEVSA